ncbi:glutathionylspermidine synthase family protein [Anoxybacteroides tepidamans]|uniref:glutathionylspermidine synthase family protein n=1 Tax=Anoxybacteroides tepidamans TaxID=265948 RepID=UPI00048430E2|nr:glutathionylspermidine synthase family protein [Anoxybacillus tepidamans]
MYSIEEHRKRRAQFYARFPDFWADLYGIEYALFDYYPMAFEEAERIKEAANRIGHLYRKTAKLLRQLSDETLKMLGFPQESLPFLRIVTLSAETVIARADFACVDRTFKLLEFNADTPTFIRETFDINQQFASFFKRVSPNHGTERLITKAIQLAVRRVAKEEPYVVFTSHADHIEDRETVRYLQRLSRIESAYVPLHELRVVSKNIELENGEILRRGLYDAKGRRIDVLYRQTYPLEHLIEDRSPDGEKVGIELLELWKEGEVALVNPPSAFLLQSKAVQALIWGLYEERSPFFTEEEHEWISGHFLPTYLDEEYFLAKQTMYVQKPAFGREGDTVVIKHGDGTVAAADSHQTYKDELSVYQQYVSLPETVIKTIDGPKTVKLLHTCFVINGEAAGIGMRAGGMITDNLSYYLPVVMKG